MVLSRRAKLRQFEFHAEKFKELIVYVAEQCADDPTFGPIKLNKILFYSDVAAYRELGEPITGATYRKFDEGPAPDGMAETRQELIEVGEARMEFRRHFSGGEKCLAICKGRTANREMFGPAERAIVDEVVDFFRGKLVREVVEFVQREPGCAIARDREVIPYETSWLRPTPADRETIEAARRIAEERGYGTA